MTKVGRFGIVFLFFGALGHCTTLAPSDDENGRSGSKRVKRKYTMDNKAGSKQPESSSALTTAKMASEKPTNVAAQAEISPTPTVPIGQNNAVQTGVVASPSSAAAPPMAVPEPTRVVAAIANKSAQPTAAMGGMEMATKPPSNCVVLPAERGPLPIYFKERNFIVTRLLTSCTTPEGIAGFERSTQWMAMGFPCTGGRGKIEWTDKYVAPKQVAFLISNNCPMAPQDTAVVAAAARSTLGFSDAAKLLAYTPFAPQFWEIIGSPESDVGYAIELRTSQSLTTLWNKVREGQPLSVRMYGRENAWVQGDVVYEVEADIMVTAKDRFKLTLSSVKALNEAELAAVKSRCEALKPKRNCSNAF